MQLLIYAPLSFPHPPLYASQTFTLLLPGQAGDPDGAATLAKRAMTHFNSSRFWGQHYDWCDGDHCDGKAPGFRGADVLSNTGMVRGTCSAFVCTALTNNLSGAVWGGSFNVRLPCRWVSKYNGAYD
jgi:hypothetical protein